jgi:ribosome-binding factor A
MASEIRRKRFEANIIELLNEFLLREVTDSTARKANFTGATMVHDMSHVKVFVDTIYRGEINNIVSRLNELKGLFRSYIAKNTSLRVAPTLNFVDDTSLDHAKKIESILRDLDLKD